MSSVKRHKFKNGLELVYQKSHSNVPITSIYVFCKVGSAFENEPVRGMSHLLEHMCFAGTEKVKKAKDLLLQYNTIGAYVNAYTTTQHTGYYIKCDDQHFEHAYGLITDILLNSTFPKKDFIKEQNVVVEENIRGLDDNRSLIENRIDSIYFRGSSYEYPIDSIEYHPTSTHLKYDNMIAWYKWFYTPSNMVISIISQLSFSHILHIVSNSQMTHHVAKHVKPSFASHTPCLNILPIHSTFSVDYYQKKGVSTTLISLGFRTCSYDSKDIYTLQLLEKILNGFSGRLFTEFRTMRGLTYHSSCSTKYHKHTGYFSIFIQTDPSKLLKVLSILVKIVREIKQGVSEDEINRSKSVVKGSILRSMENMDIFAKYNGMECMYGSNIIPYQDIYSKKLARITKKQVNDAIDRYFHKENMVVCILYDKEINKKKINSLFS